MLWCVGQAADLAAHMTPDVTGVRKTSLMVLSHLILNDMMKVKGHIARMAMCMRASVTPEEQVSATAVPGCLSA